MGLLVLHTCGLAQIEGGEVSDPQPTTKQVSTKCLLSAGHCAGAEDTGHTVGSYACSCLHSRVSGKRRVHNHDSGAGKESGEQDAELGQIHEGLTELRPGQ